MVSLFPSSMSGNAAVNQGEDEEIHTQYVHGTFAYPLAEFGMRYALLCAGLQA